VIAVSVAAGLPAVANFGVEERNFFDEAFDLLALA